MALMADFAASGVREHRGPSPWVAALLTILTPGLGHLYIGQARRGITLFILILIADTLLMFAMMGVLGVAAASVVLTIRKEKKWTESRS